MFPKLLISLLLVSAADVHAHNWVNSPSRSEFASTVNPALPSQTGLPHVKVIAGQDFQVEWVNGHDSDCYWILVPEKDAFKNLLKMNQRANDDYLNNAPATQRGPPPKRWQKYHRKYDKSLDNKPGDSFFAAVTTAGDNDPNYMLRPDVFDGRFTGAPKDVPVPNLISQMTYKQGTSCTDDDRRVEYTNDKYPFVIAMHRYRLCTGQANRPDVTRITFPADTAPGKYVVQWQWRGYYDIVDVEIVAGTTPVALPYGKRIPLPPAGIPAQYRRVDHCVFPEATPAGSCYRMLSDARGCMQMCDRLTEFGCQGVAVVPVRYPKAAYQGFKNVSFMPYSFTTSCNQDDIERGANDEHFACFAATARPKTDTMDQFYVTNDPQDPAFYSTCFMRIPYRQSMNGTVPTPDRLPTYVFGNECISCKDALISTYESAIMGWQTQKTCANCEIEDVKLAPAEIPKPVPKKGAWKNVMDDTTCLGFVMAQPSPNATCPMNMICALNMYPPGGKGADVSDYDCHLLAKADPRCGKYMIQRAVGHENQASCMCYRGEGGNLPCCGPCVTKRIKDLILSEI